VDYPVFCPSGKILMKEKKMRTLEEPFRNKMVETVRITTEEYRTEEYKTEKPDCV
jgi:tryptophanase